MAYNEKLGDRMREVLAGTRGLVEKKMFGGIAFMWKDKMFCGIIKDDMMVRVLEERYDELVERDHARPMDFVKARPMRGFIYVSLDGLKTERQLSFWIACGKEYAEKSPPKKKTSKKEEEQMTVEDIRSIALKCPHATEDVKWGADLCFCIAEKMFCVTSMEGEVKFSLKVPDDQFEELCQRQGFIPAPYMARNKWVLIDSSAKLSKKELEAFIKRSYELVKSKLPKKLQEKLK